MTYTTEFIVMIAVFAIATLQPWRYLKDIAGFLIVCLVMLIAVGKANSQTLGLHIEPDCRVAVHYSLEYKL